MAADLINQLFGGLVPAQDEDAKVELDRDLLMYLFEYFVKYTCTEYGLRKEDIIDTLNDHPVPTYLDFLCERGYNTLDVPGLIMALIYDAPAISPGVGSLIIVYRQSSHDFQDEQKVIVTPLAHPYITPFDLIAGIGQITSRWRRFAKNSNQPITVRDLQLDAAGGEDGIVLVNVDIQGIYE